MNSYKEKLKNRLMVRKGNGLYEVTDIYNFLDKRKLYSLTKDGFLSKIAWESDEVEKAKIQELNNIQKERKNKQKPEFLKIKYSALINDANQIVLQPSANYLNIPLYQADELPDFIETARFYQPGDVLTFDFESNSPLCFSNTIIKEEYLEEFVLKRKEGFCLESHDFPHIIISQKADNSGFIIIGKQDCQKQEIQLAGFNIPLGSAIYLPENIIHSDAYLVGEYRIAFTAANHYQFYKFDIDEPLRFMPLV